MFGPFCLLSTGKSFYPQKLQVRSEGGTIKPVRYSSLGNARTAQTARSWPFKVYTHSQFFHTRAVLNVSHVHPCDKLIPTPWNNSAVNTNIQSANLTSEFHIKSGYIVLVSNKDLRWLFVSRFMRVNQFILSSAYDESYISKIHKRYALRVECKRIHVSWMLREYRHIYVLWGKYYWFREKRIDNRHFWKLPGSDCSIAWSRSD